MKSSITLAVGVLGLALQLAEAQTALPANLLKNGSFEDGAAGAPPPGWEVWQRGPSKFLVAEGGRNGGNMVILERSPAEKDGFVLADQYVQHPFTVGAVFRLSAWLRADQPIDRAELVMFTLHPTESAGGGDVHMRKPFAVGTTWKRYSVELSTAVPLLEGAKGLRVVVQLYRPNVQLYVDDVTLSQIGARPVDSALFRDVVTPGGEPDAIGLNDGTILLVFGAGQPRARISRDEGQTWEEAFKLDLPAGQLLTSGWSLIRLKSGAIGLICGHGSTAVMFCTSKDEGKTWSQPQPVGHKEGGETWVRNGAPIVLSTGRIVLPACAWEGEWTERSFAVYSDDEGGTWQRSKGSLRVRHDGEQIAFEEPCAVELKDGRLLMVARTPLGRLFQSFSADGGVTWSEPEPTSLTSSYAPACISRLPKTGDLLIIWNQSSVEEVRKTLRRHRLTCAVSKDEGKTWTHFRNLESLDDTTKIDEPVNWEWRKMAHEPDYKQPEDRARYHRAPGPLRCGYPWCITLGDKVVVGYDFGCNLDPVGQVYAKVRILPVDWFYESRP